MMVCGGKAVLFAKVSIIPKLDCHTVRVHVADAYFKKWWMYCLNTIFFYFGQSLFKLVLLEHLIVLLFK